MGFKTYDEFREGQLEAARRVAGATRSDWNNRYGVPPYMGSEGTILGQTQPDGTIELDQPNVTDVLEDAFAHAGEERSEADKKRIRNALKTWFHEDNRLLVREGSRSRAVASRTVKDPGVLEFEEGVTEAYTVRHLDQFIAEIGFEEIVPGISAVEGRTTYPNVEPGAVALASAIGQRSGLSVEEVLAQLNRVDHEEKWDVAADLVYNASDLPEMVPDPEREAVRASIRRSMQVEFIGMRALRIDPNAGGIDGLRARSTEAGRAAAASVATEVDRLEQRYRDRQLQSPERAPTEQSLADEQRESPEQAPDAGIDTASATQDFTEEPVAEPSPYVASESPTVDRSVDDLRIELDGEAEREAAEANPDRVYATDTLTTDRGLAEEEWDRQQADPNRQYVAEVQEEPESVRTERLAAEQAAAEQIAAEQIDNDLNSDVDSDLDEASLADQGFDGRGADTLDRAEFDPAAANEWAPPAATDRVDRPALDQQQDPQQQNGQQTTQQRDGQDRGGERLEAGDRDPSTRDREAERPEDRPDRDQQPDRQADADRRDELNQDPREQDPREPQQREQQQGDRDPNERGDQVRDDRDQPGRQQPDHARDDERDPAQQDPSQPDPRDAGQDVDRQTQDQNRQDQNRQDQNRQQPGQRDPNQRDQSRDDRQQPDRQQPDRRQPDRQQGDRQQDRQQDPAQRDQSRNGQVPDGRQDPAQRDPNQRGGAQQDPRQQGQQDPRQQGQQGQQDPRRQGQQGQQDPRQQQGAQGQRDPRMQAQQDPRQQAQGRQQPVQDPRQQGQQGRQQGQQQGAAAAAPGGGPGGPPGGPPNDPRGRGGAAQAQDPRKQQQQQRKPQKQSLRNQTAKKLSDTARKAPQAAEAILDAADPQGQGGRRRQGRQRSGSGSDFVNKLKQLKDGGQRSPRGATKPPSGPPKATPHGRGVHNAGQHNQKLKDQHTPQREQGEGREIEHQSQ